MTVYRENGADGDVEVINESDSTHFNNLNNIYFLKVTYRTIDKSAYDGKDFVGGEGKLSFKSGETAKDIKIPIIDDMSASGTDEYFEVKHKIANFKSLSWV